MLNRKTLIYILDDQPELCDLMHHQLIEMIPDIMVKTFVDFQVLLDDPDLLNVDLFIIDVILGVVDGRDVCNIILKKGSKAPVLFISGIVTTEDFFENMGECYAVDFIERPYAISIFINRVKVLLSLSLNYQKLEKKIAVQEKLVWDVFNHSQFYIVVVCDNRTIKLANYRFAIDLGFKSENEMIGRNCFDFISKNQSGFFEMIDNNFNDVSKFREIIVDVMTLEGKTILVRWFNGLITNGERFLFSIGVPIKSPEYGDSIESIRSYFNTVLDKDREMIMAMTNHKV